MQVNRCRNFRIKSKANTSADQGDRRVAGAISSKEEQGVKDDPQLQTSRTRRNDQFMASSIGDVLWLDASLLFQQQISSALEASEINDGSKNMLPSFDKTGFAPIHLAAANGHLSCLSLLIESYGVDVNLKSETSGWTPIHLCISAKSGRRGADCLRYLLQRGADHSIANDNGVTPAHRAVMEGLHECLVTLIQAGASIHTVDRDGRTPLQYARSRDLSRILQYGMWHRTKELEARRERENDIGSMRRLLRGLSMKNVNNLERRCESLSCSRSISQQSNNPPVSGGKMRNARIGLSYTGKERSSSAFDTKSGCFADDEKKVRRRKTTRKTVERTKRTRPESTVSWADETSASCGSQVDSEVWKGGESDLHSVALSNPSSNLESSAFRNGRRAPSASTVSSSQKTRLKYTIQKAEEENCTRLPDDSEVEESQSEYDLLSYEELKDLMRRAVGIKPTLFVSHSIADQTARRHYDADVLPKAEISLHMLDDPTSWLFKNALIID